MWFSQEEHSWPIPGTALIYRWCWNEWNLLLRSEEFLWCNNWSSHHRKLGPCMILHENNLRILSGLSDLEQRNISPCYPEGPNWILDGAAAVLKDCSVSIQHLTAAELGEGTILLLPFSCTLAQALLNPVPSLEPNVCARNSGELLRKQQILNKDAELTGGSSWSFWRSRWGSIYLSLPESPKQTDQVHKTLWRNGRLNLQSSWEILTLQAKSKELSRKIQDTKWEINGSPKAASD